MLMQEEVAALYLNATFPKFPPPFDNITTAYWAAQRSKGDAVFTCATHWAARTLTSQPMYQYFYTHPTTDMFLGPAGSIPFARHSSEIPFMFDMKYFHTAEERVLGTAMGSYWGSFVVCGSPNACLPAQTRSSGNGGIPGGKPLPTWPAYGKDYQRGQFMQLDVPQAGFCRAVPSVDAQRRCDFMLTWLDRQLRTLGAS